MSQGWLTQGIAPCHTAGQCTNKNRNFCWELEEALFKPNQIQMNLITGATKFNFWLKSEQANL